MRDNLVFIVLVGIISWFSVYKRKLTGAGTLAGVCIAVSLYTAFGLAGVWCLGCFFMAGILATSWKFHAKTKLGLAEENKGRRNVFQVLANGGVAGLLGLICWMLHGHRELLLLMVASALSAAIADTVSSELGSLYGKRFLNIITFKTDTRGENGVVSIQGTFCGLAGSCLLALIYAIATEWNWGHLLIIIVAGTIGNLFDSLLGATLERTGKIGNNTVNFLNTACGAITALLLSFI